MDRGWETGDGRSFHSGVWPRDGFTIFAIVLSDDAGVQPGVSPPGARGFAADTGGIANTSGRVRDGADHFHFAGSGGGRISREVPHSWRESISLPKRRA